MFKTALSFIALLSAAPALADLNEVAQLDVIPGWTTNDGTQIAGLNITLAAGWKTYWRAPGDGGIPPVMFLEGSENIESVRFHWPIPEVFEQNGMRSVGYMNGVVLPIELTPNANGPIHLSGALQIGVCEEVCVPVTLSFDTVMEGNVQRDPLLLAALLDRPLSAAEAGVGDVVCSIDPTSDGLRVTTTIDVPRVGSVEALVVETNDPSVWVSEAETQRRGGQITGTVEMVAGTGQAFALDRSALRFTVIGQNQAVDIIGCSAG